MRSLTLFEVLVGSVPVPSFLRLLSVFLYKKTEKGWSLMAGERASTTEVQYFGKCVDPEVMMPLPVVGYWSAEKIKKKV